MCYSLLDMRPARQMTDYCAKVLLVPSRASGDERVVQCTRPRAANGPHVLLALRLVWRTSTGRMRFACRVSRLPSEHRDAAVVRLSAPAQLCFLCVPLCASMMSSCSLWGCSPAAFSPTGPPPHRRPAWPIPPPSRRRACDGLRSGLRPNARAPRSEADALSHVAHMSFTPRRSVLPGSSHAQPASALHRTTTTNNTSASADGSVSRTLAPRTTWRMGAAGPR